MVWVTRKWSSIRWYTHATSVYLIQTIGTCHRVLPKSFVCFNFLFSFFTLLYTWNLLVYIFIINLYNPQFQVKNWYMIQTIVTCHLYAKAILKSLKVIHRTMVTPMKHRIWGTLLLPTTLLRLSFVSYSIAFIILSI